MDTGILHTHHLLGVVLLVMVGIPVVFPNWSRRLGRWHMVLDSLLLLTGLYLIFRAPAAFSPTAVVKYLLVAAAIVLAIVGNRKGIKRWNAMAFLLLTYAYGISLQRDFLLRSEEKRVASMAPVPSVEAGAELYKTLCQRCHGSNGQAGYRKSPSLHPAQGDTTYWIAVIRNGKGIMPAHPYLSESQIQSLILFLQSWQKSPSPTP